MATKILHGHFCRRHWCYWRLIGTTDLTFRIFWDFKSNALQASAVKLPVFSRID